MQNNSKNGALKHTGKTRERHGKDTRNQKNCLLKMILWAKLGDFRKKKSRTNPRNTHTQTTKTCQRIHIPSAAGTRSARRSARRCAHGRGDSAPRSAPRRSAEALRSAPARPRRHAPTALPPRATRITGCDSIAKRESWQSIIAVI